MREPENAKQDKKPSSARGATGGDPPTPPMFFAGAPLFHLVGVRVHRTHNAMDTVVDFLTQKWDYGPEVCLAAFALYHSARVSVV